MGGNIPIEFNKSQNFTRRTEILCCLTAHEDKWVSNTRSVMAERGHCRTDMIMLMKGFECKSECGHVPKYRRGWTSGRYEKWVPALQKE